MGLALIGQGLNFLAMLLPIIGLETGQLAYLMLPLALSTVLSRTSILGYHSRYLTLPAQTQRTATSTSLLSLLTTTVLCLAVGAFADAFFSPEDHHILQVAGWTAMLMVTNGIYFMAVAVVTQEERMDIYSIARLAFGIVNVAITTVVVFFVPFQAGLIVAAAVNPVVGAVLILSRSNNRIVTELWADRRVFADREHRAYLSGSRKATGGVFLAEAGFQFQGFITPFLGPYQELWAVVVRLTGGFGTLAQQLVAPPMEARIGAAIRGGDSAGTRRWCRRSIQIGLLLGLISAAVQIGAVFFSLPGDDAVTPYSLILISIYCLFWMPSAMCAKIPLMKGLNKEYLIWSVSRLVLLTPLLLLQDGTLFTGIVTVMSVTSMVLMWASLRPSNINP